MSVATEVEVRRAADLVPSRPILAHAAALGDLGLIAAVEDLLAARRTSERAFERLRLLREASEKQRLSDEAADALHLSQAAGTALEDDVQRLAGDAEDAWNLAASGWARAMFVPEEIRVASREYVGRRRAVRAAALLSQDGLASVGLVDWSRGAR